MLGLVIAEMLFEAFPKAPEGDLSRRLADLVRKETCAEIARVWGLGDHLRWGEGERRSGAKKRDAISASLRGGARRGVPAMAVSRRPRR